MARPIEKTLRLLQDAMAAHRKALADEPEGRPAFRFPTPQDHRQALTARLLAGLEKRAGLDASQAIAEKLLRIFAPVDLAQLEAHVAKLESLPGSDSEWLSLIESLTVHETYIMRDPSQLEFFASLLPAIIDDAARGSRLLRFWSVGCSTGEEAYSIAALVLDALVEAGKAIATDGEIQLLSPWRVEVIGSDISRRALERARQGVYETGPLSSFRNEATALLHHFPASGPSSRAVSQTLRDVVRFESFNIVDGALPARPFDAVFCRNVFIYFSERARRHAYDKLANAVRPGGLLLLGPTDVLLADSYETLWAPSAVAYRRRTGDV